MFSASSIRQPSLDLQAHLTQKQKQMLKTLDQFKVRVYRIKEHTLPQQHRQFNQQILVQNPNSKIPSIAKKASSEIFQGGRYTGLDVPNQQFRSSILQQNSRQSPNANFFRANRMNQQNWMQDSHLQIQASQSFYNQKQPGEFPNQKQLFQLHIQEIKELKFQLTQKDNDYQALRQEMQKKLRNQQKRLSVQHRQQIAGLEKEAADKIQKLKLAHDLELKQKLRNVKQSYEQKLSQKQQGYEQEEGKLKKAHELQLKKLKKDQDDRRAELEKSLKQFINTIKQKLQIQKPPNSNAANPQAQNQTPPSKIQMMLQDLKDYLIEFESQKTQALNTMISQMFFNNSKNSQLEAQVGQLQMKVTQLKAQVTQLRTKVGQLQAKADEMENYPSEFSNSTIAQKKQQIVMQQDLSQAKELQPKEQSYK